MVSPLVILASASPRRQDFFHALAVPFAIETADIDETPMPGESPVALVERLAAAKALTAGRRLVDAHAEAAVELLVVGADTIVALENEILGKPAHADEAYAMLLRLRARPHHVHTALAVARFAGGRCRRKRSLVNTTTVTMRPYRNAEIAAYVATGDPLDKAGAYAIQHQQLRPVQSLSGCPAAVMGLPAADLLRLLAEFDFPVARAPVQFCRALTGFPCCQENDARSEVRFP